MSLPSSACAKSARAPASRALAAAACAGLLCSALIGGCATRQGSSAQPQALAAQQPTASAQATATSRSAPTTPPTALEATPPPASPKPSIRRGLPRALDTSAILADTRRITALGVRRGGSRAEHKAGDYILAELRRAGYRPSVQTFSLPGGQSSRNISVVIAGSDPRRIVIGAHTDSRVPSPGANDDAVGCAVLLELAREAAARRPTPTIELDFFGAEEFRDATPGAHHFGSRARVASLSSAKLRRIKGMITLDVIAVGSRLHTRTMGRGPLGMSDLLLREARRQGVAMSYLRDEGPTGWSDHEAYENAGVPVAWVERLSDAAYHTRADTSARLKAAPIAETVGVVLAAVNSLDTGGLDRLR